METRAPQRPRYRSPEITEPDFSAPPGLARKPLTARLILFGVLFGAWVLLSGRFDGFHLTLGLVSCALVTAFSGDLLLLELQQPGLVRAWVRFARYLPWLLYQIFLSNLHILRIVLHPRMMELIDPQIIRFRSPLTKELALVAFANSITLTPGTITVYVSVDGDFQVHAIDRQSADALPGEMETRIMRTFTGA